MGSGSGVMSRPVVHFLGQADVVFAVGTPEAWHGDPDTLWEDFHPRHQRQA